ncbi:acyl carrier protein [Lentzea sp. NPDC051213]|uniref:acyl carrier protein n=1 Tax=Lentzea sp. NPDC051213 TaxID=3364126 RepID=UPI0037B26180
MSTVLDERKATIKRLACAAFEIEPHELDETTSFIEDLGVDSLSTIDLLANLETEFGIEIDQDELPRMVDLDGVYDVVAQFAGWESAVDENAAVR